MNPTQVSLLAGLLFGPFIHEDVALLAAVWLVKAHRLPWQEALLAVFAGMLFRDAGTYALGAAARRIPRMKGLLGPLVARFSGRLDGRLLIAVMLCHLMPAILFPTFFACGWTGVKFRRFALCSIMAGGFYAAVMFGIWSAFGEVLHGIGPWAWAAVFLIVVTLALINRLRWMSARRRCVASGDTNMLPPAGPAGISGTATSGVTKINPAELIPGVLFYLPIVVWWCVLSIRYRGFLLPTVANPNQDMCGMWGDSKSGLLRLIAPEFRRWVAPFVTIRRSAGATLADGEVGEALAAIHGAGLDYPIVAKPDRGCQGYGVRRITSADELKSYVEAFPPGETLILQQMVPWDGEVAVFYVRRPDSEQGQIESMAFTCLPTVIGDGTSTLRQIIQREERAGFKQRWHMGRHATHLGVDAASLDRVPARGETVHLSFIGSMRTGGVCYDAQDFITPALQRRFDAICRSMPEFHFGRFDARFKSVERLRDAEDFLIIEVNGAGSETLHVWDPRKSVIDVYRGLFRFQAMLFEVGAQNRSRGFATVTLREFVTSTWHFLNLIMRYPASN